MITVVDAVERAFAASAATLRACSGVAAASAAMVFDRKKRVVDAGAAPVLWLRVVSDTTIAPPAAALAGAVNTEMTRSGLTVDTASMVSAAAAPLFVSLDSLNAPSASAPATTK